ncbi:MAG: DUF58 domain-containing protein [Oscillospiraceae bacterium]|nr:DUF58 domain-containing protein [Oscillospiraceae bacterium]
MLRARLIYAVLLVGLAIFYILYIDPLPLLMLVTAVAVPLLLRLGLLWLHFAAECSVSCQAASCTAREEVPVTFTLKNRCPLFFSRGEAELRLHHGFGTEDETLRIKFPVHGRNTTRLTFYIRPQFCGEIEVQLRRVLVYDLFRLSRTRLRRADGSTTLLVLPRPVLLPLEETAPPADRPESEVYADRPGDDPSEVFGIREYVPGDAVSRMHWKLSSRSDKMYVKEFSRPVEKNCILLIDCRPSARKDADHGDVQTLLTVVWSIAAELLSRGHICELVWYDADERAMVTHVPEDEGALVSLFQTILHAVPHMQPTAETLYAAAGTMTCASVITVTNDPQTLLPAFAVQGMKANHRTLLLISDAPSCPAPEDTEVQRIRPGSYAVRRIIV